MKEETPKPVASNVIIYSTHDGNVKVDIVNTINYHLKEIYKSSELQAVRTIRNFRTVQFRHFQVPCINNKNKHESRRINARN